jgi:hypothetical protein
MFVRVRAEVGRPNSERGRRRDTPRRDSPAREKGANSMGKAGSIFAIIIFTLGAHGNTAARPLDASAPSAAPPVERTLRARVASEGEDDTSRAALLLP